MKMNYTLLVIGFLAVSCMQRGYNSPSASTETQISADLVTINPVKFSVNQAMLLASVDNEGDCRGGNPKYKVNIPQSGVIPLFQVSIATKRICIAGQATPNGQDIKYWDLPTGMRKDETYVIWGERIITYAEWVAATTGSGAEEKKVTLRSKQGLTITVNAKIEKDQSTRNITSFRVGTDQFGAFRTVVTLKCQANHYPSVSYHLS